MSWDSENSNDEEVVINDSDNEIDDDVDPHGLGFGLSSNLMSIVRTYSAVIYDSPAEIKGNQIDLSLPRDFLPLSLQAVYGFTVHANLLDISLVLTDNDWHVRPKFCDVRHPVLGRTYVGAALVASVLERFFQSSYKPQKTYRSQTYILVPSGTSNPKRVKELVNQGFDQTQASKALIICKNNISQATTFLLTGDLPSTAVPQVVDYNLCPLLYLIFELADAFLDLPDHCCLCRDPMPPGVKPSVCQKPLCTFQASQIGVGISVIQEIARDPLVADLVVSMFSAAVGTTFLTPSPPDVSQQEIFNILQALPAMTEISQRCQTDSEIQTLVGRPKALDLLRWIIVSNRSHLISLPPELQLRKFPCQNQFMTMLSSPEAEEVFNGIKGTYGSCYLWHGSNGQRWHSIIRNGLKNATGTHLQANGAALGEGIYFAKDSSTSWGYSRSANNHYPRSVLGEQLQIISLCEIAKIRAKETHVKISRKSGGKVTCKGFLKDHGWAHTLTMEQACVVRFLFVGGSFQIDVLNNPPKKVPTLKDVLEHSARAART